MKTSQAKFLLGAHMSISKGVQNAIYNGFSIGCTTIAIFTGSNRQWASKLFSEENCKLYEEAKLQTGITEVISHASYLINLGSKNKEIEEKSIIALKKELYKCDQLKIKYLVLHPGSGSDNKNDTIEQVIKNLNKCTKETDCMVLIENMAGQGSSICSTFEEIAKIIHSVEDKHKIGVCIDTCHLWAAGYDFSNEEKYEQVWLLFDQLIGISKLKTIHMNDSVKNLGSHVDRHADIGKGSIGIEAFRLIMNDKNFFDIPKILETPVEDEHSYLKNLNILKSLISPKNKKILKI